MLYVGFGEENVKRSIRQMKEVRWEYALSRYLRIRFINVTMGNSNTANSLFTKINGIIIPGLLLAATSYASLVLEESGSSRFTFQRMESKG
jgi:hypothetical protein